MQDTIKNYNNQKSLQHFLQSFFAGMKQVVKTITLLLVLKYCVEQEYFPISLPSFTVQHLQICICLCVS